MAAKPRRGGEGIGSADRQGNQLSFAIMEAPSAKANAGEDTARTPQGIESTERELPRGERSELEARTHLRLCLELAVPLWAMEARRWPEKTRWQCIREAGEWLANYGDSIQFKSPAKMGREVKFDGSGKYEMIPSEPVGTAPAFNKLARGLGCLALEAPDELGRIMRLLAGDGWECNAEDRADARRSAIAQGSA